MSVRLFFLLVVAIVAMASGVLIWRAVGAGPPLPEITYSKFLRELLADQIQNVHIRGKIATGRFKDGKSFRVTLPYLDPQLADDIAEHTEATFEGSEDSVATSVLVNASPFLLLIGFWVWMMRSYRRSQKAPQ